MRQEIKSCFSTEEVNTKSAYSWNANTPFGFSIFPIAASFKIAQSTVTQTSIYSLNILK